MVHIHGKCQWVRFEYALIMADAIPHLHARERETDRGRGQKVYLRWSRHSTPSIGAPPRAAPRNLTRPGILRCLVVPLSNTYSPQQAPRLPPCVMAHLLFFIRAAWVCSPFWSAWLSFASFFTKCQKMASFGSKRDIDISRSLLQEV